MPHANRYLFAALAAFVLSCAPGVRARPHPAHTEGEAAMDATHKSATPPAEAAARAPIARKTGHATASDGAPIYYEVCGSGPALVLVHGLGGNHAVWFQQVAHFAATHTVVTMSQRGFAPSGGDQKHYDVPLLVRDLEAVMDAASVRRAVVIGQSMGGWTALGLAMRSPERVEALVLADTLGGIDDEVIAAGMRRIGANAARLQNTPPPFGVHPALSAGFSAREPDLAYLYQTLTTFGAPAPGSIVKQLMATRVPGAALKDLRVPTLFLVGSEDQLFPPALVRQSSAYIAGAEVSEIAGAGHSPYFERPDAWNEALERFLARR